MRQTVTFLSMVIVTLLFSACSHAPQNSHTPQKPVVQGAPSIASIRVPSEDSKIDNFHKIVLNPEDGAIYRSADPFRKFMVVTSHDLNPKRLKAEAQNVMKSLRDDYAVRTIISLKEMHEPSLNEWSNRSSELEGKVAREMGIELVRLPLSNAHIATWNDGELTKYLMSVDAAVKKAEKKGAVLIHCTAGTNRAGLVSAFLRLQRMKNACEGIESVIAEMRKLGHNWSKYVSANGKDSVQELYLRNHFGRSAQ